MTVKDDISKHNTRKVEEPEEKRLGSEGRRPAETGCGRARESERGRGAGAEQCMIVSEEAGKIDTHH